MSKKPSPAWAQNGRAVTNGRTASPGSQASERTPIANTDDDPGDLRQRREQEVGDVGPQAQAAQRGAMARPQLLDRAQDDEEEHERPDRLVAERDPADDRAAGHHPGEDAPPHTGLGRVAGRSDPAAGAPMIWWAAAAGERRSPYPGLSGSRRRLVHARALPPRFRGRDRGDSRTAFDGWVRLAG